MTPLVLSALSTLCACVPMVTFLGIVWWLDRYDREPLWLVVLTFLWGGMGGVVSAVIGSVALQALLGVGFAVATGATGADLSTWAEASGPVLVAPAMEEPAKAAFLLYVIWNRHFDNMTDGFVYGAAAGLGFGMTENFLYFVGASGDVATWGATVVIRTFYSALMHATATSIVGATLGFARFRGCFALVASGTLGLGLAMTVHATWNGLLMLAQIMGGNGPVILDYVLFPLELLGVLVVFEACVLDESFTIRRELEEEAKEGRIPADHPKVLSSWFRRLFPHHLLPPGGNHALYVQTATALAKRKRQVRQMGARVPEFYRDEVDRLRRQLEVLQAPADRPPGPPVSRGRVSNLLLVAACLALGVALARAGVFPTETPRVLNAFVLYVALPASVFVRMRAAGVDGGVLLPASMAWLQLAVVAAAVEGVGRRLGWDRPLRASLLLTAGVANTSFVGWPLIEALVGPEGLPTAILADQLGSFVVVSTVGTAVAAWGAGSTPELRAIALKVARFPALPALVLAVASRGLPVPAVVLDVAERLGGTLTPLALISVGFQLRPGAAGEGAPLAFGLALKLLVVPAALLAVYLAAGVEPGLPLRVTLLEAAMPPMITGAILAIEHGLAPALAGRMVGVGIPLGVVTVAAWSRVLPVLTG